MIVAAREFTSAAEIFANAKAAHRACFTPKMRPVAAAIAPALPKPIHFMARKLPEWQARPTEFDAHVVGSIRILEMIASGEIVITPHGRRSIPEIVCEVLSSFPGITIDDVRGIRRARKYTYPRQIAMFEVHRQRKDMSFPSIGRWFGGRDHTTVLHAVRKIEAMRAAA